MDLYLIRHADALPVGEGITTDEERPLSPKGEAEAKKAAKALLRHDIELDTLLTSPLVRARQTAEIMAKHWDGGSLKVEVCEFLAPGSKAKDLARFLADAKGDALGLVGHMPGLADWAAWCIGSKKAQLDFAKTGIAHIVCDRPGKGLGTLAWLVTPRWFG